MSDEQFWQSLMYLWNKYPIKYGLKEESLEDIWDSHRSEDLP